LFIIIFGLNCFSIFKWFAKDLEGGEKLRKVAVLILAVALSLTFAVSSFSTVSATVTYTDHQNALGASVIDVEGHPKIVIDGYHFDSGDLGVGDVIRISYYMGVIGGKDRYWPVAIFIDIPQRAGFLADFYATYPTSIQLVDDPDIDVRREGKSKTIMIVWKTALEVPEEQWGARTTPAFTIPPGRLIFRGHGDEISGTGTGTGNGWLQTATWTGYYGDATFVCPTWDFGGPVGVDEGEYRTAVRTDVTIVSTK
jgi:hypothetical protein